MKLYFFTKHEFEKSIFKKLWWHETTSLIKNLEDGEGKFQIPLFWEHNKKFPSSCLGIFRGGEI